MHSLEHHTLQGADGGRRRLLAAAAAFLASSAFAQGAALRAELPAIKVGDHWKSVRNDRRTGAKEAEFDRRVTAVSATQIEGIENDGTFVWTPRN